MCHFFLFSGVVLLCKCVFYIKLFFVLLFFIFKNIFMEKLMNLCNDQPVIKCMFIPGPKIF